MKHFLIYTNKHKDQELATTKRIQNYLGTKGCTVKLKVKESDRIATVTAGLRAMGCDITPTDDGMIIRGGKTLHGAEIDSYLDHRIAMSFAVAALAADGVTSIKDADCVKISYPNFYDDLLGLAK